MQNKIPQSLEKIIERLSDRNIHKMKYMPVHGKPMPSGKILENIIESLRSVLFPGFYGESKVNTQTVKYHIGRDMDWIYEQLTEQIRRGICFECPHEPNKECQKCKDKAPGLALSFMEKLPDIRKILGTDVEATFKGDPASKSPEEIIFCYPGIKAIINYRIAHELLRLDVPLLPRIITEMAHSETGIDIHPRARIGDSFVIDHGTGVVIGATSIIGNHVKIYQGVTLGAKSFPSDKQGNPIKGIERHPIVEDHVIIYAEATILGRVTIGANTVIGGNVWITRDIPPNSRIIQQKAQTMNFSNGEGI